MFVCIATTICQLMNKIAMMMTLWKTWNLAYHQMVMVQNCCHLINIYICCRCEGGGAASPIVTVKILCEMFILQ